MGAKENDRVVAPRAPIRRFDIFAEYNRIRYERRGMPSDQAQGFALWLAKLVAARKFARTPPVREALTERLRQGRKQLAANHRFLELGGEPQTDQLFRKQIVARLGEDFYDHVFSPAIAQAIDEHRSYEDIRDRLRTAWNQTYEQQRPGEAA